MYGILHNGSKALIWPKYDCSIPILNPRWLSLLAERNITFPPPEGWELEYSSQKISKILDRFDLWVFIITINQQKALTNRIHDFPRFQEKKLTDDRFGRGAIANRLQEIPRAVIRGEGKIILEDCLEKSVIGCQRNILLELLDKAQIPLSRVRFLNGVKRHPDDLYLDTFESQTLIDFLVTGNDKREYDYPNRTANRRFLCLNRRICPHRISVYQEFIRRDWLDESYFSYQAKSFKADPENVVEHPVLPNRSLPNDSYHQEGGMPRNGFTDAARLAFNDSSYYLVTETLCGEYILGGLGPWLFITEKTYRSFLYQIPFILVGNTGVLRHLQSQGYEVDFDGIGMEYNDSLLPIPELLDRFQDLPIANTSVEQCRHNYNLYWEKAIDRGWDQILGLLDL